MRSKKRLKTKLIRVRMTPDELAEAHRKVKAFSYPHLPALIRDLLMDVEPKSTLDQQAILELVRVSANQGRLGGLLKHWLQSKGAEPTLVPDIRALLRDIEKTQQDLKTRIRAL
ncbi:MAG: hypothetical protein ABW168_05725 [Sedimenticola sp.]